MTGVSKALLVGALASVLSLGGCAVKPPDASLTSNPTAASTPNSAVATPIATPAATVSTTASATPAASAAPTTVAAKPSATPTASEPAKPKADTRKGKQLGTPYAVNGIIVVSKAHRVSAAYTPKSPSSYGLTKETAAALKKMTAAAKKAGVRIVVRSGYRSYATQKAVYQRALRNYPSVASAKRYNAPPGASEHQTGLSLDLWDGVTWSLPMANTATGKWLHKHVHEYGFVLRYPKGKDKITGYSYEPWHFRYIGVADAKKFGKGNTLTLEEYLGLA
ncbi:MAG TPA: M15 family metallopeptidase [Propionicimonas sp.]|nr:M15 family metallopeptidase [Propionicimonas sp.]HRA06151.1 M15 family metallopeptidase [Propionicimonas sp.]